MTVLGPNIEFTQVCLDFWDEHLKGKVKPQEKRLEAPKFRVYLQDACVSSRFVSHRPGEWVSLSAWPDPEYSRQVALVLHDQQLVHTDASARHMHDEPSSPPPRWQRVPFNLQVGQNHGEWLDFGAVKPAFDQRPSDAYSLRLDSQPLSERTAVLGFPELRCRVRVTNHDRGVLVARLNHVTPAGESTMITYGYLNLTLMNGREPGKPRLLELGTEYDVTLKLHAASYVIPQGEQLRLALSSCYWPGTWPSSKHVHMEIQHGYTSDGTPASVLTLPTLSSDVTKYVDPLFSTTAPQISTPLPLELLSEPGYSAQTLHEPVENRLVQTVSHDSGLRRYPTLGVTCQHKFTETHRVVTTDPLSAVASTEHENVAEYEDALNEAGEPIRMRVLTSSQLKADHQHFYFNNSLKCLLNDQLFFERDWKDVLDRQFI